MTSTPETEKADEEYHQVTERTDGYLARLMKLLGGAGGELDDLTGDDELGADELEAWRDEWWADPKNRRRGR